MTDWDDNWGLMFARGPAAHLIGGIKGFTKSVVLSRHEPVSCKPGLWNVALACGSEVADMLCIEKASTAAVQDDFGNLVAVAA